MNAAAKTPQGLLSFQLQLTNNGIDTDTLKMFLHESVDASGEYYRAIESILTPAQRLKYKAKHYQAVLLLCLLND